MYGFVGNRQASGGGKNHAAKLLKGKKTDVGQ